MMLNSVDLPQPDGPISDTNSPGMTSNDTSSTAVMPPSAVAKRLTMPSTLSSASAGMSALPRRRRRWRVSPARRRGAARDAHVDDRDQPRRDVDDGARERAIELGGRLDRSVADRPLRAADRGEVDRR